MGSSSSAPAQPTTTTNMANFGSTTSGSSGDTWTPTEFQNKFVTNSENAMLNAQNALSNRSVSAEKVDAMNKQFTNDFNTNYLSPAMQKGLLRGSTASDVYTMGQKQYAQDYQDLIDQEEQRQYQALANALSNYTTIYDIAKGTTGLSQSANNAASNYALAAAAMNNSNNNYSGLSSALGGLGSLGSLYGSTNKSTSTTTSDKRLKENIEKLDTVNGINIYKFDYIDGAKDQVGVIAQEILDVIPEAVKTMENGYYAVDYSKLPQEVQDRIEELR